MPAICAAVDQLALPATAPRLLLDRLQVWQRASALVLEAQQTPAALLQLVYSLQQALLPLGVEAADREYRPHLTLAVDYRASRQRPAARRISTSPPAISHCTSRARALTGRWRSGRCRADSGRGLAVCEHPLTQPACRVQVRCRVRVFAFVKQGGTEYLGAAVVENAVLDLHAHRLAIAMPFEGAAIGTGDTDQCTFMPRSFLTVIPLHSRTPSHC